MMMSKIFKIPKTNNSDESIASEVSVEDSNDSVLEVNPDDEEIEEKTDKSDQSGGSVHEIDDDETSPDGEVIVDDDQGDFDEDVKVCHKRGIKKTELAIVDEDDCRMYAQLEYTKVKNEDRITDPYLTYYEIVGIIGIRGQQFNYGAKPLVKGLEGLHPAKMAYLELVAKMTPIIIRRNMPNKLYEDWHIRELDMVHTIDDAFFVPENFDWDALMTQATKFKKAYEKYKSV